MKQIRKRLTYANVMSSIAVFMVLGASAVAATQLPKNSVGTKQLKAKAVKANKLARNAVRTGKIAKEAVKAGKLAKDAVVTDKIANGAVVTDRIANGAVASDKLADGAVLSGKLAAGAVGTDKLSSAVAGVALAGVNVAADGTVRSWFNRFGGEPTIGHTAVGDYGIKFPGLELNVDGFIHQATRNGGGVSGFIRVRSQLVSPGDVSVRTRNSENTVDQDVGFFYTVYGAQ